MVVGAGIGGLAAALCFRQRGVPVRVVERAPAITEVGAGLQISPNGGAVLRALGLGPALEAASLRAEAVVLSDYRRPGDVLRLDLRRRPDQYFALMHRADLIGLLEAAARAAGIPIALGREVTEVRPGARPEVVFADGSIQRAALVVGADGLHSPTRAALNGADSPFFTGQVAWRAVVPLQAPLPREARVVMAPGRHLVFYPLRDGRQANLVAIRERSAWTEEGWHHADDPETLRATFADVRGPARPLLDAVTQVGLWGLFRHPVAAAWHGAGVAILGDAAHPTLPFLAQGANLALEDAWVLADSWDGTEASLSRYQARRRDRAQKVISAANRNAWKYHVRFGPARAIGHTGLRMLGALAPEKMLQQFDWIYGCDVTQ
ncbi:monooxygenase [Marinibacterium profundimaris]|uniref:Monooxygenase n=1 Tax=Marinibacterium profundimaris TaxID=1679460 RepID=A0A225NTB3_9RHOB|nr:monooxygenase [Marinibacterium profundimaris]